MKQLATCDLSPLFSPMSVAIIGASNDQRKYGNWLSVQALRMRKRRPVYLVNQRGEPVLGQQTYRRLADVGAPVDLVVIAIPARGFEEAVEDALAVGTRAIVGISAGFAELGESGRAREAALVERIRSAGAVLLGPNCLGVLDTTSELYLTSNAMPSGPVGLISQSGNMALELSLFLEEAGLGFSRFASLGNAADLTIADLLRSYAEHDGTRIIAVYCEDFGDGRAFVQAAADTVAAGKPVILLTVGASQASMRSARTHTGALTSAASVIDAACRAAGVDQVMTPRQMIHLITALCQYGAVGGCRCAVISDGGGHASVTSDIASAKGLVVSEFDEELVGQLRAELPPSAGVTNPIDLAGAGEQDITSFTRTLGLVLDSPDVDVVLLTGYFGGYGVYGDKLAQAEIATAESMAEQTRAHGKPVVVHTMYANSPAADKLRQLGGLVFRAVEDAADTLARLAIRSKRSAPRVPQLPSPAEPIFVADYWAARELLRLAGLPFPSARIVRTTDEAVQAGSAIGYPVVLKALNQLHKSDVGGVALGLVDADALIAAYQDMAVRLQPTEFCVEATVDTTHGVELIVGVQRDPRFGPIAMVGLGGLFTEVLRDVVYALAPVDLTVAEQLLLGLRAAPLLQGTRGRRPIDIAAASQAIVTITLVATVHPELDELEVNPLLVLPSGTFGLDARITLTTPPLHEDKSSPTGFSIN